MEPPDGGSNWGSAGNNRGNTGWSAPAPGGQTSQGQPNSQQQQQYSSFPMSNQQQGGQNFGPPPPQQQYQQNIGRVQNQQQGGQNFGPPPPQQQYYNQQNIGRVQNQQQDGQNFGPPPPQQQQAYQKWWLGPPDQRSYQSPYLGSGVPSSGPLPGNSARGDASRGNASRGGFTRGNSNRGNANRGNINRGNANRGNANRGNASQQSQTPNIGPPPQQQQRSQNFNPPPQQQQRSQNYNPPPQRQQSSQNIGSPRPQQQQQEFQNFGPSQPQSPSNRSTNSFQNLTPHTRLEKSMGRMRAGSWPEMPPPMRSIEEVMGHVRLGDAEPSSSAQRSQASRPEPNTALASGGSLSPDFEQEAANNRQNIRVCTVVKSWRPYSGDAGLEVMPMGSSRPDLRFRGLTLTDGQDGYVCGGPCEDMRGNSWFRFNLARTNTVGWARAECLAIYDPVREITIKDLTTSLVVPTQDVIIQARGSILQKTVDALYKEIDASFDALLAEGASLNVLTDFRAYRDEFRDKFLSSIPRDVRNVIDNGQFNFDDLWNLPRDSQNWITRPSDNRAVVYLILFRGIDGIRGNDGVAFYTGKTIEAGARRANHDRALLDATAPGQAYVVGRRAESHRMMVLCNFSTQPLAWRDRVLRVSEQTGVMLFHSWTNVLTSTTLKGFSASEYIFDAKMAQAFSAITKRVCKETHWNIPPGRGLNWRTPLTEMLLLHTSLVCRVITPDKDTGELRIYSAVRRKLLYKENSKGKKTASFMLFNGGGEGRGRVIIQFPLKDIEEAEWPTHVDVVVEVYMGRGKRHPIPWARLPEPGPFTGWEDLNRMGVKCEWQDLKGKWYARYLQCRGGRIFMDLGVPQATRASYNTPEVLEAYQHASEASVKARCIWDTLLDVKYLDGSKLFPWVKRGPRIRVTELHYDHRNQQVLVKGQAQREEKPERLRSFDRNYRELDRMYSPYFKPLRGMEMSGTGVETAKPRLCALCNTKSLLGNAEDRELKCPSETLEIPTGVTCRLCFKMRRPCVWIPRVDALDSSGKYTYIGIPKYAGSKVFEIQGPAFQKVAAYRPVAEEISDELPEESGGDDSDGSGGSDDED